MSGVKCQVLGVCILIYISPRGQRRKTRRKNKIQQATFGRGVWVGGQSCHACVPDELLVEDCVVCVQVCTINVNEPTGCLFNLLHQPDVFRFVRAFVVVANKLGDKLGKLVLRLLDVYICTPNHSPADRAGVRGWRTTVGRPGGSVDVIACRGWSQVNLPPVDVAKYATGPGRSARRTDWGRWVDVRQRGRAGPLESVSRAIGKYGWWWRW